MELVFGVIGIGVSVIFGIVAIYMSRRAQLSLNGLDKTDVELNKKVESLEKTHKKLEDTVGKIEDATRRIHTGFVDVFMRTREMIGQAQRELWLVNLTLRFGKPHTVNQHVVKQFARRPESRDVPFDTAVTQLWELLVERAQQIPHVRIVSIDDAHVRANFLDRLKSRLGYEALSVEVIAKEMGEDRTALIKAVDASRSIKFGKNDTEHSFKFYTAPSIPIQLLIVGLPENKVGCLAFLVGTETIGGIRGEESGFYTEAKSVVDVFREVAASLTEASKVEYEGV